MQCSYQNNNEVSPCKSNLGEPKTALDDLIQFFCLSVISQGTDIPSVVRSPTRLLLKLSVYEGQPIRREIAQREGAELKQFPFKKILKRIILNCESH